MSFLLKFSRRKVLYINHVEIGIMMISARIAVLGSSFLSLFFFLFLLVGLPDCVVSAMGDGIQPSLFCVGGNACLGILGYVGLLLVIAHDAQNSRNPHPLSIASGLVLIPTIWVVFRLNILLFLAIPLFILWIPILLLLTIGWL